jgi:hypothetical protein
MDLLRCLAKTAGESWSDIITFATVPRDRIAKTRVASDMLSRLSINV